MYAASVANGRRTTYVGEAFEECRLGLGILHRHLLQEQHAVDEAVVKKPTLLAATGDEVAGGGARLGIRAARPRMSRRIGGGDWIV